jgi:hypothetical protein
MSIREEALRDVVEGILHNREFMLQLRVSPKRALASLSRLSHSERREIADHISSQSKDPTHLLNSLASLVPCSTDADDEANDNWLMTDDDEGSVTSSTRTELQIFESIFGEHDSAIVYLRNYLRQQSRSRFAYEAEAQIKGDRHGH